jgi:hypothetical protein
MFYLYQIFSSLLGIYLYLILNLKNQEMLFCGMNNEYGLYLETIPQLHYIYTLCFFFIIVFFMRISFTPLDI